MNSHHQSGDLTPDSTQDPRARYLAEIAAFGDEDNSECAEADLFHEFPDAGD